MGQKAAVISRADVERIVLRDFPDQTEEARALVGKVAAALQGFWSSHTERAQAATLKLANGDLERLRKAVAVACQDFRDVLTPAEYPQYARVDPRKLTRAEQEAVFDRDREQYEAWFGGPVEWR